MRPVLDGCKNRLAFVFVFFVLMTGCGDDGQTETSSSPETRDATEDVEQTDSADSEDGPSDSKDEAETDQTESPVDASDADTGDPDAMPDTSPDPVISYSDFRSTRMELVTEAFCQKVFECPGSLMNREEAAANFAIAARASGPSACRPIARKLFTQTTSQEAAARRADRIGFDDQKGKQCLEDLRDKLENQPICEVPVDHAVMALRPCESAIEPKVSESSPCLASYECTGSNAFCSRSDDGEKCYGTCSVRQSSPTPEGQKCNPDDPVCASGLTCEPDPNGPDSICVEKGSRGEGQQCSHPAACARGLTCGSGSSIGPGGSSSTCSEVEFGDEGANCGTSTKPCQPGLVCAGFEGLGGGSCQPPLGAGDECIQSPQCEPGLYCAGVDEEQMQKGSCESQLDSGGSCDPETKYHLDCSSYRCSGETCVAAEAEPSCSLPDSG